jgi:hypothetical protein
LGIVKKKKDKGWAVFAIADNPKGFAAQGQIIPPTVRSDPVPTAATERGGRRAAWRADGLTKVKHRNAQKAGGRICFAFRTWPRKDDGEPIFASYTSGIGTCIAHLTHIGRSKVIAIVHFRRLWIYFVCAFVCVCVCSQRDDRFLEV